MPEVKSVVVADNPNVDTTHDWLALILGLLGALKLILAAPPFEIQIAAETWDAWANLISVLLTIYGVVANTYISKRGKQQKSVIQQVGLDDTTFNGPSD